MNQKITGFRKDLEDHWVTELDCGHSQHVRHDPPWMERLWVTTTEGRDGYIGKHLNCIRCDEFALEIGKVLIEEFQKTFLKNYQDAGISGLCEEGRLEAALGTTQSIDILKLVQGK